MTKILTPLEKAHRAYVKNRAKWWRTGEDKVPAKTAKQLAEEDWGTCLEKHGADWCIHHTEQWEREVTNND